MANPQTGAEGPAYFLGVPAEGVPKVFVSGGRGMTHKKTRTLNFVLRMRGILAMDDSAFLCVFAPLRESKSF
jgi:hypothetical protein